MIVTPEASRAARALLGWSMRDLAARAGVSLGVVQRIEAGGHALRSKTAERIATAFRAEGVELIAEASRTGAVLSLASEGAV